MTAAQAMAAPDSPSAALQRRDLCSRGIRLAGKMRSDVVDLLDAYVSSPVGPGALVGGRCYQGPGGSRQLCRSTRALAHGGDEG